MKAEARDLRDLAHALEETCRRSPAHSMAWEPVMALSDYLQLRAHVIELHDQLNPLPRRDDNHGDEIH